MGGGDGGGGGGGGGWGGGRGGGGFRPLVVYPKQIALLVKNVCRTSVSRKQTFFWTWVHNNYRRCPSESI